MAKSTRYTVEDLKQAVAEARSYAEVLKKLGLRPAGGNYKYLRERLDLLKIDYSHFKHQGWARNQVVGPKRPLTEYLCIRPRFRATNSRLKSRLLSEGILEYRCSVCDLVEWQGGPIPLELDHISGVNTDNRIENLRLVCPNCHALTPTYRGRNRGRYD